MAEYDSRMHNYVTALRPVIDPITRDGAKALNRSHDGHIAELAP